MRFGREFIIRGQRWVFDPDGRFVYPPDPGPYDPCWCFSLRKFKFCHIGRHRETPTPEHEGVKRWESAPELRLCLHPNAPAGCSDSIIAAHSVQRKGAGLATIARSGKVYGSKLHPRFFMARDMRLEPALVGTSQIATFPGFCGTHDNELFRPLETAIFSATDEQLFLLGFRCIARRLLSSEEALQNMHLFADADRGLNRDDQRRMFIAIESHRINTETGVRNLRVVKSAYDDAWRTNQLQASAFVVWLEGMPEVVCSTLVEADIAFDGTYLPQLTPPEHVCFTMISDPSGQVAVWSWRGPNPAAERLVQSFCTLPRQSQAAAVLRYVLEFVDTPYFSPAWWEDLSRSTQDAIVDRMTAHVQPFAVRSAGALLDDGIRAIRLVVD